MSLYSALKRMTNRYRHAQRERKKPKKRAYRLMCSKDVAHMEAHIPAIERACDKRGNRG